MSTADLVARCVVVFAFGTAHEALNVAWVHYSERGDARRAAMVAVINSTVCLAGIAEALGSIFIAASYVAGEACGTWLAIRLKTRAPKDAQ